MDLTYTLDFLTDLADNNNKEWMDANKKRYQSARQQVIELIAQVIEKCTDFDEGLLGVDPKKTLFRINRDVRFSNNKDPYKTNFGASITAGGVKLGRPGYYIHIKPGECFVGGGMYQPSSEVLQKVRQEIDYNGAMLVKIIEDPAFKTTFGKPYGETLKTAPKGYPKDHEYIELLRLKHYTFMRDVNEKALSSDHGVDDIAEAFRVLYPFNQFISQALD